MEKVKKKILILAGDTERKLIKDLLKEDYTTITLEGIKAIDKIREDRPDIILLGCGINNLDPEELPMAVLKGNEEMERIPVVLIYSEDDERLPYNKLGASFVKRPIDKENLLSAIYRASPISFEPKEEKKRILIVDDNEATRKEIRGVVENLDYSTLEARSGSEALNIVNKEMPDLIILDIILPDFDGFKILRQLKRNLRTKHIPVILLSAIEKPEEKAKGLILGASDFITKPFSPLEFSARVEMLLERTEEGYGASPNTRLPGNISIEKAITGRIRMKRPFAVCYCDLDNFKVYNDAYGFFKGDKVITLTAQIIMETIKELGNNDDFIGHIGGDDFILITTPDKVDALSARIVEIFDKIIPFYYDKEARAKGYIEGLDRQGRQNRFPIISISIAVVDNMNRNIGHIGEVSDIAAKLKKLAKMTHGSVIIKDRRKDS